MALNANWKTDYYADLTTNIHPNDAGHLLIANLAKDLYLTMGSGGMSPGLGLGLGGKKHRQR